MKFLGKSALGTTNSRGGNLIHLIHDAGDLCCKVRLMREKVTIDAVVPILAGMENGSLRSSSNASELSGVREFLEADWMQSASIVIVKGIRCGHCTH